MVYHKFFDGNKAPITLYEKDGRIFSSHRTLTYWHQVASMSSRDEDVLLCGYPKSGLHWLFEIVTMLKRGNPQLSTDRMENNGFLMISSLADLDNLPCPRVLTTHRRFHELPADFIMKRRKIVCILREPKDVCVSYYHMLRSVKAVDYDGNFDGFVPLFLEGHVPFNSWAGWVLSFEKGLRVHPELSVHVIHFERLKEDPVKEITRLAHYLGAPMALVEDIASQTVFSSMKSFKEDQPNPFGSYYKNNTDAIFRSGETEQWRQYFSAEEAQQFKAQLQKQLGRPSLKARL